MFDRKEGNYPDSRRKGGTQRLSSKLELMPQQPMQSELALGLT